jgi:hypothetical protein
MSLDLTDQDKAILTEPLRETIERNRLPLSPRRQEPESNPREARRAAGSTGTIAAAQTAG